MNVVDLSDAYVAAAVEIEQIPIADFDDSDETSVKLCLQGVSRKLRDALNKLL